MAGLLLCGHNVVKGKKNRSYRFPLALGRGGGDVWHTTERYLESEPRDALKTCFSCIICEHLILQKWTGQAVTIKVNKWTLSNPVRWKLVVDLHSPDTSLLILNEMIIVLTKVINSTWTFPTLDKVLGHHKMSVLVITWPLLTKF